MRKKSEPTILSSEDRLQLEQWHTSHTTPKKVALHCRIVLAAANGQTDLQIASDLKISRHTVALWRQRIQQEGIQSVWEIASGRGRKHRYDQAKRDQIIEATLQTKPFGMTHWSCRLMAEAQGVSKNTVHLSLLKIPKSQESMEFLTLQSYRHRHAHASVRPRFAALVPRS